MLENLLLLFIALTFAAGFWLAYGIVSTELRHRREQRKHRPSMSVSSPAPIQRTDERPENQPAIRGYDSPELFYRDSLIRLRQLEKDIGKLRE